ncbi:MAG: radical SAM protein [Chitinispirillaceae bacterium]|nr:radical SAM protein [Chitinispirillaceae bacterium]
MTYRTLFGPVTSRRLGISLGVDCLDAKRCSLDCVYCECGTTVHLTTERAEYVEADAIIAELSDYLKNAPNLDYITFGGSGEPTLNNGIGRVIRFLKSSFPQYHCALLTNGTLFYLEEVRRDVLPFDIVLPNLDAVSQGAFDQLNRPHTNLRNETIINGLVAFRAEYRGTIWLEVFIGPGINDTPEEIRLLRDAALTIAPDRVQLNTLDRPGTCDWVSPAPLPLLKSIARDLAPLPVEIISRSAADPALWKKKDISPDAIRSLIARRPSTIEEIAAVTGLTINETNSVLSGLLGQKTITATSVHNRTFYRTI